MLDGMEPEDAHRMAVRLAAETGGNIPAMVARAHRFGRVTEQRTREGRRICRLCGCWEGNACPPTCSWAEYDLCSQCAVTVVRLDAAGAHGMANAILDNLAGSSPAAPAAALDKPARDQLEANSIDLQLLISDIEAGKDKSILKMRVEDVLRRTRSCLGTGAASYG